MYLLGYIFPMPTISREQLPLVVGGVFLLALIGWYATTRPTPPLSEPTATTTPAAATTTPVGPATTTKPVGTSPKPLPPEQPFTLPAGATAIDAYAYVQNNSVYFRSLTGKTPLNVWDANANSFHRVGDFVTYPGNAVVGDCGAAPIYTYYSDNTRLYFYQVWRTPTFRSSTVEAVQDAKARDFELTGLTTATDGSTSYEVSYRKATSTCRMFLSKTAL